MPAGPAGPCLATAHSPARPFCSWILAGAKAGHGESRPCASSLIIRAYQGSDVLSRSDAEMQRFRKEPGCADGARARRPFRPCLWASAASRGIQPVSIMSWTASKHSIWLNPSIQWIKLTSMPSSEYASGDSISLDASADGRDSSQQATQPLGQIADVGLNKHREMITGYLVGVGVAGDSFPPLGNGCW